MKVKLMFTIIVLLFSYAVTESRDRSLTKEQKRQYYNNRIFIDSYFDTYFSFFFSYPIVTSRNWSAKIDNKRIRESKFYNLLKERDYYKRARRKEKSTVVLLSLGIPSFLAGSIMLIGFRRDHPVIIPSILLGTGGIASIAVGWTLANKRIVDIQVARSLASGYNKELKVKLLYSKKL